MGDRDKQKVCGSPSVLWGLLFAHLFRSRDHPLSECSFNPDHVLLAGDQRNGSPLCPHIHAFAHQRQEVDDGLYKWPCLQRDRMGNRSRNDCLYPRPSNSNYLIPLFFNPALECGVIFQDGLTD